MAVGAAERLGSLAARERRGGRLSTAAAARRARHHLRDGRPAHSDPDPVPLQPQRLRARQADGRGAHRRELRSVLHRPVLHSPRFYRTLRVAAIVTAICLVLAFPLAYTLARTQSRFKNLLIMLVVLPLFVGNAVRAAGWMTLFGNRGFLNVTLAVARPHDGADPLHVHGVRRDRRHPGGQPSLRGADAAERDRGHRPAVEDAAFSLGAGPFAMARRVLLPLALPGFAAGAIFCFILTMNAYATPVLLGGPEVHDDGTARLRAVRGQEQLAVRGRGVLRPDGGDADPDRGRQPDGAAPLSKLTVGRSRPGCAARAAAETCGVDLGVRVRGKCS